jgi:hypothetical protein
MCETFHLEYTEVKGIHAWADWEIYHHYAGPHMEKGDFWKIHLGRRVELDEEDLDGSMFIEDLLEDALMYPMRSKTCERTYDKWETIEEIPGIWLTRLQAHKEDDLDHDDILSEDDSSEHECSSQLSEATSDEDRELENPSGPAVHVLDEYSSGDDTDSKGEESAMTRTLARTTLSPTVTIEKFTTLPSWASPDLMEYGTQRWMTLKMRNTRLKPKAKNHR